MRRFSELSARVPRLGAWASGVRGYMLASSAARPATRERLRILAFSVGLASALLYGLTAHYGPGGRVNAGDSAKFQYLPIMNGTPHSTGYPAYLLISKVFYAALPFLHVSARVTLLSVVCAAGAVAGLFLLSYACTGVIAASLLAAGLFGTSMTFWLSATDAEVYALHMLFYVCVSWCLVEALNRERPGRVLYTGLLLYALSFGNHLTSIALLPAVVWTLLSVEGKALWSSPRKLGTIFGFVLLGISQYGYIYYLSHGGARGELEFVGSNTSWSHLFEYMTGQQFKSRFFAYTPRELLTERSLEFLGLATRELSAAGLALAALGFVGALLRPTRRRFLPVVLLALAGQLFIALNYQIEAGLYFVPAHLLLAVMAAQGIAFLNRPRLVVPIALSVAGLNVYVHSASSPLGLPPTPLLAQVRWQSSQAVGCKQVLAAPDNYFISRIRRYFRYSDEYPGAKPYGNLKEVRTIDGLCVDGSWRQKLAESGGFYLPPQPDTLEAFFLRNTDATLLVALWVDHALDAAAQAAFKTLGSALADLGPSGAYVAVVHDGRVLGESLSRDGHAKLLLRAGQALPGFTPHQQIELRAAGDAFGKRTSIKLDGHEQGSPRKSFRLLVLDPQQRLVGDASTSADALADFHLFYRALELSDAQGTYGVPRVLQASGIVGTPDRLVDGVLPSPGSHWDCPECVLLDGRELSISVELPQEAQTGLALVADNNESFTLRCASSQKPLGSIRKVSAKGMRRRVVAFTQPCATVLITLEAGDERASIGEIQSWRPEAPL
jgi:transmembrane protein TMEM260 (protein O-mannosyltransferase)